MEEKELFYGKEAEKARPEDCDKACNENDNQDRGLLYGDDIYDEEFGSAGAAVVYTIVGIAAVALFILACMLL